MQRPQDKPRIGLALGSGGARGWSHIGVIRGLAEHGVQPDVVCGTSIGALVGAAYAAEILDPLEEWLLQLGWSEVLKLVDVTWRGGFIRGRKLFDFFRHRFEDRRVEDLRVPFGAVATELDTGHEVWLREGSLLDAVRASIAMPGLFAPIERDGKLLVDGGLVNPVPVSMCRALGAEIVIAVDLVGAKRLRRRADRVPAAEEEASKAPLSWMDRFDWLARRVAPGGGTDAPAELPSILEVYMSSIDIMQVRVARSRLAGEPADVLITPLLPDFTTIDFHRAREAIVEGRAAVERMLPMINHVTRS